MCNKIFIMPTRRGNLTNILLYAIIAVAIYLIQRICAFDISNELAFNASFREMYYPEYIIAFACLVGLSVWYIYVEKKKGDLKLHIPLIILLGVLAIASIVMIFVIPSAFEVDVPVYNRYIVDDQPVSELDYIKHAIIYISLEQKILYVIVTIASLYLVYLLIWVMPRKIRYLRGLNPIMYLILIFGLVSVIISLATEMDSYKEFFEMLPQPDKPLPGSIDSFLGNRNSFGMLMVFCIFASLYLHHTNSKWWFLLFPIPCVFFCLVCGSKTNFLIAVVVLLIYYVVWIVLRFRKRLVSSIILLSILTVIIGTAVALAIVHSNNEEFLVDAFNSFDKLWNYFIRAFDDAPYFSGREHLYNRATALFNMGFWGVGLGYGMFNYVFNGIENIAVNQSLYSWDQSSVTTLTDKNIILSDSPHSSFYQIVGTGGILTIVVYVVFIAYLIFAIVRIFKKHIRTALLCSSFLIGLVMHSFTEAPSIFFMGPVYIDGLIFTIFVAVPVLSLYHHDYHPSENKKFLADYGQIEENMASYDKSHLAAKSVYFFMTPVMITLCVIAPLLWPATRVENMWLIFTMFGLIFTYIALPFIVHFVFDSKSSTASLFVNVTLPYLAILVVFGGFIIGYRFITGMFTLTMGNIFMIVSIVAYFALFRLNSFFFRRAGVITPIMDGVAKLTHKHQQAFIKISRRKDRPTLQEKVFAKLKFKRASK